MGIYVDRDSRQVIRQRGKLRSSLYRMAAHLDNAGQTTAPITLPCTYVDLCKLGLTPYHSGAFLFHLHPVKAVRHG